MSPVSRSSKRTSQLPVLSLFKSAGEILLAHESLDEMLQQVVNLIAEHLPGRRGVVCMVDQASGEIQPRCFSQERGVSEAVSSRPRSPYSPATGSHFLISRSILHEAVRVR